MLHRFYTTVVICLTLTAITALGGTLDLAIIQLNGPAEVEEINDALRGETLSKAALGDRFQVKNSRLRGVPVLFAQTFAANPGNAFKSSTRIGVQRAEVEGFLGMNDLQAAVALSEGIVGNFRRFSRSVYQGKSPLVDGQPRVLGLRQVDARAPTTTKGRAKITTTQSTIALLYQFRR